MIGTPQAPTGCSAKALAASGQVKAGPGTLVGILCTSSSSLVLDIYDAASATGSPFVDDLSMDSKETQWIPVQCNTAIYVSFASGSGKVTVFYI